MAWEARYSCTRPVYGWRRGVSVSIVSQLSRTICGPAHVGNHKERIAVALGVLLHFGDHALALVLGEAGFLQL